MTNAYRILSENLEAGDYLGDLEAGGRVILKVNRKRLWTGFICFRMQSSGGLL
jgi:hypothetical protein